MLTTTTTDDDASRLLTDPQVAKRLGVSVRTVKQYRYTGELPYVPIGHGKVKPGVRVRLADVDALVARRREPGRHEPRRGAA